MKGSHSAITQGSLSPAPWPGRTLRAKETAHACLLAIDGSRDSKRPRNSSGTWRGRPGAPWRVLSATTPPLLTLACRAWSSARGRGTDRRRPSGGGRGHGAGRQSSVWSARSRRPRRVWMARPPALRSSTHRSASPATWSSSELGPGTRSSRSLMGSTSAALVDHAPCSVLVAREDTIPSPPVRGRRLRTGGPCGRGAANRPILRGVRCG